MEVVTMFDATKWIIGCGLLSLALATGCDEAFYDFRVFDDLEDETWVDSSGVPGALDSRVYAVAIASGGTAGDGASFFVLGRNDDGLARLSFDAAGDRETNVILRAEISNAPALNPFELEPVVVGDPASSRIAMAVTAGGTPEAPEQTAVVLFDGAQNTVLDNPRAALAGGNLPTALAFGLTDVAGSGARNLVALRGNLLSVIADVDSPTADEPLCDTERMAGLGLAVGDWLPDPNMGDEIAFAAPVAGGGDGEVVIVSGSLVSTAHGLSTGTPVPCFNATPPARAPLLTLTAPAGAGPSFGTGMVIGDFNGDSALDLVVAAPGSNTVHVYLDMAGGAPTATTISAPEGALEFGKTLAVGNLDGMGGDELVVGAPSTTVDGKEAAGSVFIYQFGAQAGDDPIQFHDAQPESSQRYGQSVAIVPFGSAQDILVVGADQEVFTYFRTPFSGDVRSGRE